MNALLFFKFVRLVRCLRFSLSLRRLSLLCLIALACLFWRLGTQVQANKVSESKASVFSSVFSAQSPLNSYSISPERLEVGKEYEVIVSPTDCQGNDLSNAKLFAPQGSGITVKENLTASKCNLTAKVSVLAEASTGKSKLWIKDGSGQPIGIVEIEKIAIEAGPIPPGLEPQVDIMWGVMDKKVVRDNFGHDLANDFYGIQLVIGNNSGYDLQVAGVGFRLPNNKIENNIPTNSYRATRGVLEREQEFGRRSIILNSIQATGGLLTGFLPFWRAGFHPNAAANAARWSSIVGGPLATGFGLIVPDTTVKQIVRLDDQMLRDGLIIKNNTQIRTLVFVPKGLLNLALDPGPANSTRKVKDWSIDPQYVNEKLGTLVLVGQTVTYLNRVQVIARAEGAGKTPPPTITGVSGQLLQGATKQLVFIGSNLKEAVIALPSGITIAANSINIDENGNSLRADITVADDVVPEEYSLVISTAAGSSVKKLKVEPAMPEVEPLIDESYAPGKPKTKRDEEQPVTVTLTGKNLKTVQEIILPPEAIGILSIKSQAKVQPNGSVKFTIVVKKTDLKKFTLKVKNYEKSGAFDFELKD